METSQWQPQVGQYFMAMGAFGGQRTVNPCPMSRAVRYAADGQYRPRGSEQAVHVIHRLYPLLLLSYPTVGTPKFDSLFHTHFYLA